MSRIIGDLNHPTTKDANELYVFFVKENGFQKVDKDHFPRGDCPICPPKYNKTTNEATPCGFSTTQWYTWKAHISRAEKLIGELICFPSLQELPDDVSIFKKHRQYGYLKELQSFEESNKSFYLFDLKENQFILIDFSSIRRKYIKNNHCNYCSCGNSVTSGINMINHICLLEKKYFCFLLLETLEKNSETNAQRIQQLMDDYKQGRLTKTRLNNSLNSRLSRRSSVARSAVSSPVDLQSNESIDSQPNESIDSQRPRPSTPSRRIISTQQLIGGSNDENDLISNIEYQLEQLEDNVSNDQATDRRPITITRQLNSSSNNSSLNSSNVTSETDIFDVINQMRNSADKYGREMKLFTDRLENQVINLPDLTSCLIKEQSTFQLTEQLERRNRDCTANFGKKLCLRSNDLNFLLDKYGMNGLEIENAEIHLNLRLKDYNLKNSVNSAMHNGSSGHRPRSRTRSRKHTETGSENYKLKSSTNSAMHNGSDGHRTRSRTRTEVRSEDFTNIRTRSETRTENLAQKRSRTRSETRGRTSRAPSTTRTETRTENLTEKRSRTLSESRARTSRTPSRTRSRIRSRSQSRSQSTDRQNVQRPDSSNLSRRQSVTQTILRNSIIPNSDDDVTAQNKSNVSIVNSNNLSNVFPNASPLLNFRIPKRSIETRGGEPDTIPNKRNRI